MKPFGTPGSSERSIAYLTSAAVATRLTGGENLTSSRSV